MTTTGITAALPARRSGRPTGVVLLLICIGLLTTLQALALGERNPVHDTLSSYVYVPAGWMFGAGLVVLAVGLVEVSRQLRSSGPGPALVRMLLRGAALCAVVAAFFQADRADADQASAAGELHKWSSIGLLGLTAGAVLVALAARVVRRGAVRPISSLLVLAAVSGTVFLGGQLTKWAAGGQAALADQAPWAGGLTQRILVLCLVCAVIVVSDDLSRSASSSATNSDGVPGTDPRSR